MIHSTKTMAKTGLACLTAGAMVLTAAAPAQAQSRDSRRDNRGGISAGEVIAGALIIGGIAAVAAAATRDRRNQNDRYDGYDRGYAARDAVEQCVYAAERRANRSSWGGRSKVTDVRNIDRKGDGYRVKGRIAVNQMGRDYRRGDPRYGRGWNNDYRGWDERYSAYDSGRFTCEVRRGGVVDVKFSGLRGL